MSTTLLRITVMAGAAALVAAWLAAATGTPQITADPSPVSSPVPAAVPSLMALNLAAEVDRLRERLNSAPVPHETMRNPFELPRAAGRPATPDPVAAPADAAPVAAVAAPDLVRQAVTLVGIAANETPDGPVRTVIVSVMGEVVLAKAGDALSGGWRVVDVSATAVTLTDASGEVVRLEMP